jgi:hypothetical protein
VPALNSRAIKVISDNLAAQKFLKQITYPVSELSGLIRAMK